MMRKTVAIILGLAVLLTSGIATAGHRGNSFYDQARVIDVKPIYQQTTGAVPRQHCWNEQVYYQEQGDDYDYLPTLTGAIIGGVVGSQFGNGHGQDAATIAGVLLGGAIGYNIGNNRNDDGYSTVERRCEYRDDYRSREQLVGYRVKYRYKGKVFHTRTRERPGRWIPIQVTVDPRSGRVDGWVPDGGYSDSDGPFWYQEQPRREVWW